MTGLISLVIILFSCFTRNTQNAMWFSDSLVNLGEWFSLGSRYSSEGGIFKRLKVRGECS